MRKKPALIAAVVVVALVVGAAVYAVREGSPPAEAAPAGRPPRISPDYAGTVLPPNMAPPNFRIDEPGRRYFVTARSGTGAPINIASRTGDVIIPQRRWRSLLEGNRGGEVHFDVYVQDDDGVWARFDPVANAVAEDDIDGYLVYRNIDPTYARYGPMGIYERRLESYAVTPVVESTDLDRGCIHCHTFFENGTETMLIHFRPGADKFGAGMLLIRDGVAVKAKTTSAANPLPAAFTTWHPSQRLLAFSVNHVRQFFHSYRAEPRDVLDMASDLAIYMLDSYSVTSTPAISAPDYMETWPQWSPDGKYLYFSRARTLWEGLLPVPPERFAEVRYSLMRIRYDVESGEWGELETVLDGEAIGKSITQPRFSPDGRFMVFCMSDYSNFPTFQPDSDLYLMDMQTGDYHRLECSSDRAESWHSWSSNGRWLVFSSKAGNGMFNRPYFTHIDDEGRSSKPFILPQKRPDFYETFPKLFQLPELIKEPIPLKGERLARAIRSSEWLLDELPVTSPTWEGSRAPSPGQHMWRQGD